MKPIIITIKTPKPVTTSKTPYVTSPIDAAGLLVQYRLDGNPVVYPLPDRARFKYLETTVGSSHKTSAIVGKSLFDSVYCVDRVLFKGINTLSLDSVQTTDDFSGGAGADDDQVASFSKVAKDFLTADDSVTTQWVVSRQLFEALNCVENRSWTLGLNKAEAVFSDDASIVFVLDTALNDTPSVIETLKVDYTKPYEETFSQTEYVSIRPILSKVELIVAGDVATTTSGKNPFEIVASQETSVFDVLKASVDSPESSERIYKATSKAAVDTVTKSDSGKAVKQNYVNNPGYFADDYVGTLLTF